jgi:hypothetical protein
LFLAAALVLKLAVSMSSHIGGCAPRPILQLLSVSTLLAAWRCGAPSKLLAGNDELDLLQSSDSSTWNPWGSHSMSVVVCPAPPSSLRYPAPPARSPCTSSICF